MAHLLVRHRVSDFDLWKAVFDGHAAAQRAAGITVTHVMRNVEDAGEVVLLFDAEDVERAKAFVFSPQARRDGVSTHLKVGAKKREMDIEYL
jgi:hypothetical protein